MNIEDKAPLTGNYNRTDLRLVVVDMAQSPTPDGNQARTIAASDFMLQVAKGNEVIPFEPLTGTSWVVADQPKIEVRLTADLSLQTKQFPNGYLAEAKVYQQGGYKLLIDNEAVDINPEKDSETLVLVYRTGSSLTFTTSYGGKVAKPVLLAESDSQTVLEGEYAEVWARFSGADELYVERNGKPVPEATGAALMVEVTRETAGAYEVIAKNGYGETRSAAKFIKPGEAEAARFSLQPVSNTVPAGSNATLKAEATGTPTPQIEWFEVAGNTDIATGKTGKEFAVDVFYTKTYVPVATNRFKVDVPDKPAVLAPDGVTIVTPATFKKEYQTFTSRGIPATLTPIKQPQEAPTVMVDDITIESALLLTIANDKILDDYEGYINTGSNNILITKLTQPNKLVVGDINLVAGGAGIRLKETITHSASDWAINQIEFTGSLLLPPTNVRYDSETGIISFDKSPDTTEPSTMEATFNFSSNSPIFFDLVENTVKLTDDVLAGDFAVREKARPGKLPSLWLINEVAFVAPPLLREAYFDLRSNVSVSGLKYSAGSESRDTADGWTNDATQTTYKLAAGQAGYISLPGLSVNQTADFFCVGFKKNSTNGGIKDQFAAMFVYDRASVNAGVGSSYNGNTGTGSSGVSLINYKEARLYRDLDGSIRMTGIYELDGKEYPQPNAFPADYKYTGDLFADVCFHEKFPSANVSGIKLFNFSKVV